MLKIKYIVPFSAIVIICLFVYIIFFTNLNSEILIKPDKIIIYHRNNITEIKNDSRYFDEIYYLTLKRIKPSSFFAETAIESEILEEIKKEFAIEFVYSHVVKYTNESKEREFNKLFISLGSQYDDYIIFYKNIYQSSPLEELKNADELKKYVLKVINQ